MSEQITRVRIGNDFILQVPITRGGNPEDFSGLDGDISVTLRHVTYPNISVIPTKVEREGSQLNVYVTPGIQKECGKYRVVVSYNLTNEDNPNGYDSIVVDSVGFELVPTSDLTVIGSEVQIIIVSVDTAIGAVYKGEKGDSAYQSWLKLSGNSGKTETEFVASLKGSTGNSAFEDWLTIEGNEGKTLEDFFATFGKGDTGASAYDLWLTLPGNEGKTLEQFFATFGKGDTGASAYEVWLTMDGNSGKSLEDFFLYLKGSDGEDGSNGVDGSDGSNGLSAFQLWLLIPGNEGKTDVEFFQSLIGAKGESAYESWKRIQNTPNATEQDFINYLKGEKGDTGGQGIQGLQGIQGVQGEQGIQGLKGDTGNSSYEDWLTLEGNAGKTIEEYYQYLQEPALSAASNAVARAEILVNSAILNLTPSPIVVKDSEDVAGTYNVNGVERTIYSRAFKLTGLPTVAGNTLEFDISNEPLGYNLFLTVESMVISGAATVKSEFFLNLYEVTKVYVDDNYHTKVVIRCKENTALVLTATMKLLYVKFFGDILELNITVPSGTDTSAISLAFPKVKYDKHMVCSYTMDDCPANAYDKIWTLINNKKVNPGIVGSFSHVGMVPPSDSYYPGKTLGYTDGCGIEHRFSCGVAIWAWNGMYSDGTYGSVMGDGIKIPGNFSQPYLKWIDLPIMLDFGWTICQHDITGDLFDETTVAGILEGFAADQDRAVSFIKRAQKIAMRPGGLNIYVDAVKASDRLVMICSETSGTGYDTLVIKPKSTDVDLLDQNVKRRFLSADDSAAEFAYVQSLHAQADPEWYHISSHRPGALMQGVLQMINDNYGKDGLDDIWFPSVDEFYEYIYMIRNSVVIKSVDGLNVKFKIYVPTDKNFYYRDLSALITGVSSLTGVSVGSSANCYGTSYAIKDGKLLVNLDFNASLYEKANRYVTKFENSKDMVEDLPDAQYFVNQLKPTYKTPLQNRISSLLNAPTLATVLINAGDSSTASRIVSITYNLSGGASQYMVSESSTFVGAEWQNIVAVIPFTLSSGNGIKTVYMKVKNEIGESSSVYDTITLNESLLSLNSVSINSNGATTNNRNVSVLVGIAGTPTQYKIGEQNDLSGVNWTAYTGNTIPFTVSSGAGDKTIYVQITDGTNVSSVVSDSITLVDAITIGNIDINSGALETENNVVSVSIPVSIGTATHYMLSESPTFVGASWTAYVTPASFTLSSGAGVKTLYCKVKDQYGYESAVSNDSITYTIQAPTTDKIIISLAGVRGAPTYPTYNGEIINKLSGTRATTEPDVLLKNVNGVSSGYFKCSIKLYGLSGESAGSYTTTMTAPSLVAGSNDPYPLEYIATLYTGSPMNGGEKYYVRFVGIAAGTYTIRILSSAKAVVNGVFGANSAPTVSAQIPAYNTSVMVELTGVVVSADGVLDIYTYSLDAVNYKPGLNLFEIIKTA